MNKKILAIETSGELCSVSIHLDDKMYEEKNILRKHIHSEKLIPMIDELFSSIKMHPKDLYSIAVSNGPGSFTGLRIGMTAAKGIAFAANLPIVPVPTFDALALELSEVLPSQTDFVIAINANREECYFCRYNFSDSKIENKSDIILLNKTNLVDEVCESDMVFGNVNNIENIRNVTFPRASSVAKWTYLFGEDLLTFDYDYLEPNYLKQFKVRQPK